MSKPSNWPRPSHVCRIELHRSRLFAGAIVAIGVCAIPAWRFSDAPWPVAIGASAAGLVWALLLARREMRRDMVAIVLGPHGTAHVDGIPVDGFDVAWRGPLTMLAWRSRGRADRRLAFPDAIDAAARRELRLWARRGREDRPAAAVAP